MASVRLLSVSPANLEFLPQICTAAFAIIPPAFHSVDFAQPNSPSRQSFIDRFAEALGIQGGDIMASCENIVMSQKKIVEGFARVDYLFGAPLIIPHIHAEYKRLGIPFVEGEEARVVYERAFKERNWNFWGNLIFPPSGYLHGNNFRMHIRNLLRFPMRAALPSDFRAECERFAHVFDTITPTPARLRFIALCREETEKISVESVVKVLDSFYLDVYDFHPEYRENVVEEKFRRVFYREGVADELREMQDVARKIPMEFALNLKIKCLALGLIEQCQKLMNRLENLEFAGNVEDKIYALQRFANKIRTVARAGELGEFWKERFLFETSRTARRSDVHLEVMYMEAQNDFSLISEIDQIAPVIVGWSQVISSNKGIWNLLLIEALPQAEISSVAFVEACLRIVSDVFSAPARKKIYTMFKRLLAEEKAQGSKQKRRVDGGNVWVDSRLLDQHPLVQATKEGSMEALTEALRSMGTLVHFESLIYAEGGKAELEKQLKSLISLYRLALYDSQ